MKEELQRKEGRGIEPSQSGKRSAVSVDSSEGTSIHSIAVLISGFLSLLTLSRICLCSEPITKKVKYEERPEEVEEEELQVEINPLDRDDSDSDPSEAEKGSDKASGEGGSDDEDESDDDDDEELQEIQRQLERLKREKAEERERKEREEAEVARREREERMAGANPLLQSAGGLGGDGATGTRVAVKKWYEETIFKNQAAGEQQYKKRFINDTVRNDFHKRFLAKYVR